MLAMRRRMREHGAAAVQQFGEDLLPLILLFAISVTGLMLTASYTWMKGYAYDFLAILHAITVIFTLLWLPFGKFFHIFQRPAQLGVSFYKDVGGQAEQAHCRRCGEAFASRMHVEDLIEVERQLGYRYEMDGRRTEHYQWVCPRAAGRCWPWRRGGSGETPRERRRPPRPRPALGSRCGDRRRPDTEDGFMAQRPGDPLQLIEHFGPHLAYAGGQRLETGVEPDRLVKTHCCFCGQQCGIQLKVKDNQVIGFEPWVDFPFNKGMLCPKGVKRYLQSAHPDRLLHAYRRDPPRPTGSARWATRRRSAGSPPRSSASSRRTAPTPSPCSAGRA